MERNQHRQKGKPGANAVVFSGGEAIGLNVIQACRMVAATKIMGRHINPGQKRNCAEKFGMTHFRSIPKKLRGDPGALPGWWSLPNGGG